jgi:hypothetical protein
MSNAVPTTSLPPSSVNHRLSGGFSTGGGGCGYAGSSWGCDVRSHVMSDDVEGVG